MFTSVGKRVDSFEEVLGHTLNFLESEYKREIIRGIKQSEWKNVCENVKGNWQMDKDKCNDE